MMNEKPNDPKDSVLSILVVDDDELNRRMMLLLLKREGHQVECVTNGLEALEAVKTKSYDMVLMDLQMPVMDGVDASRRIREWEGGKDHIFIVALTASYIPEKGRELYEAGIDNYIAKPFDVQHLRHILQYGLENRKKQLNAAIENLTVDTTIPILDFDFRVGIQRVGGDRETYRELLDDFLRELPEKLAGFWTYYKNKDVDGLNRAAHNLKGVSANLGALQLSEYARRLEKQVGEGYNEPVEDLLSDISLAISRLRDDARKFLANQELSADK